MRSEEGSAVRNYNFDKKSHQLQPYQRGIDWLLIRVQQADGKNYDNHLSDHVLIGLNQFFARRHDHGDERTHC